MPLRFPQYKAERLRHCHNWTNEATWDSLLVEVDLDWLQGRGWVDWTLCCGGLAGQLEKPDEEPPWRRREEDVYGEWNEAQGMLKQDVGRRPSPLNVLEQWSSGLQAAGRWPQCFVNVKLAGRWPRCFVNVTLARLRIQKVARCSGALVLFSLGLGFSKDCLTI